jgi:ferrochelatase
MNNDLENIEKFKKGILLVNLGTPESTSIADIRKYLNEFLSDPRVIDIPWLYRFLLLQLIILPTRPKRISAYYKRIWLKEGSPLMVYSKHVQEKLQSELGSKYIVELAMRYGDLSIEKALNKLKGQNLQSIFIIPLFPQYASASTASVIEKVMAIVKKWQVIPDIKIKSYFYNDPNYLDACSAVGKKYLEEKYDHILFSFHGIPERQIKAGDYQDVCQFGSCCETITESNQYCYRAQCFQTAYAIAVRLGIPRSHFTISFQSRLGRTPWIKPYTDFVIRELAEKGFKKILVFCPSFVSDCLETLYEVSIEYNELFKSLGGIKVQLVESLNADPLWVKALEEIVRGER